MPRFSFAIAEGFDAAGALVNVESIVTRAPHVLPDQLATFTGPVKRRTLDHAVQRNGTATVTWQWDVMSPADFNALILAIFGGFTAASAFVTIVTLDEMGNYTTFNAVVDKPHPGADYRLSEGGWIRDLRLMFTLDGTTGGFSAGFSFGFEV